jgi:hypothetical protein
MICSWPNPFVTYFLTSNTNELTARRGFISTVLITLISKFTNVLYSLCSMFTILFLLILRVKYTWEYKFHDALGNKFVTFSPQFLLLRISDIASLSLKLQELNDSFVISNCLSLYFFIIKLCSCAFLKFDLSTS